MDLDLILEAPDAKRRRLAVSEVEHLGRTETAAGSHLAQALTPPISASISYTQACGWNNLPSLSTDQWRCHPTPSAGGTNITDVYPRDGSRGDIYNPVPQRPPLPPHGTSWQYGSEITSTQFAQDTRSRDQCKFAASSQSDFSFSYISIAQQQRAMAYSTSSWIDMDVPQPPHDMYNVFDIVPALPIQNMNAEPPPHHQPGSEIVCFGMVAGIPARCARSRGVNVPEKFLAKIISSETFAAKEAGLDVEGWISSEHVQMIHGMLEDDFLTLEVSCIMEREVSSKPSNRVFRQRPCLLNVVVYGPLKLFSDIGSFFEEYGVYLQDPLQAGAQDSIYCNPHRLSSVDLACCPLLSDFLAHNCQPTGFEVVSQQPDLFDMLTSHAELAEYPQPQAIGTILKRHQKQALTFMRRREQGWAFDTEDHDLWEAIKDYRGLHFLNRVAGTYQRDEPPPLRGGIIADPMGLGKTLTMIALAAADRDLSTVPGSHNQVSDTAGHGSGATLIIVPPPLLGNWEEEVLRHTTNDTMKFCVHHGKSKITHITEIDAYDIIITTYNTVSAEWKHGLGESESILFSKHWNRLILDEAHVIRNERSAMSRAVCQLEARARWAVTGTPVQNRLDDLASLFKFIRAYPYDEPKNFKAHVSALWKSGEDEVAIKRLKYISSCLLLRRPKATISLPPRHNLICRVELRCEERRIYEDVRGKAIRGIEEALQSVLNEPSRGGYINVLQRIESLRLICNLGLYYYSRHATNDTDFRAETEVWGSIAQDTFNFQRNMASINCSQCSSNLDFTETLLTGPVTPKTSPHFFRCLKFCCTECCTHLLKSRRTPSCGHRPCCPGAPVSINSDALESSGSFEAEQLPADLSLPSKIEALIEDIKSRPRDEKCIVFSTWRLTLGVIEAGLKQVSIQSVRFDGKVPQKERQNVIKKFREDPGVRVMLLTLSCGAVGLTLTAASRAYLMEPHWNPNLEEQALARIHRLGQTREVTAVRFYIRDSIEEQVIELQATKKHLAGVLLSPHDGDKAGDHVGNLHRLRALL